MGAPLDIPITIKGSKGTFDAMWNGEPAECKFCGEEVGFGKTARGKWVPFDIPETDDEPAEMHRGTCGGQNG